MTRRGLLSVLPAMTALAQQPPPEAPPGARPTREQDLEDARATIRANSEALARVKIPQATEPAFQFKV